MKIASVFCVLLLGASLAVAAADTETDVELHWPGKALTTPAARDDVLQIALRVLQSSNFHSGPDDAQRNFRAAEVQAHYRKEVAGRYLLVSYPTVQSMHTVGGQVRVREIVIGLNRDDSANSLFTIDDSGRIVEHARFSGAVCIELLEAIRRLT
ncbi:MAG: hypothetical protein WDO56_37755 [Gammaproteobacteria bacterium]